MIAGVEPSVITDETLSVIAAAPAPHNGQVVAFSACKYRPWYRPWSRTGPKPSALTDEILSVIATAPAPHNG